MNAPTLRLQLFDDTWVTVNRTRDHRPASNKRVWVGRDDDGAQAVLTVVDGVLTGTVFFDNRTFEVTVDPDGQYTVAELDPAAFPTDDPIGVPQADLLDTVEGAATAPLAAAAAGAVQIDAMIVWTPNAEAAAGGRAAMESLALASAANANLVYANSGINAQLNLVYTGPVAFTESPGSISSDLSALRITDDGRMDQVHSLRTQYGADLVTLIGEGYRSYACGMGYLMTTVNTSFASSAFSIVDRTCAVGNLSYAHETGHNQGLNHDAANAGGASAYSYAYGYQSPSGLFRTLMAYGSAVRIPFLSSPTLTYNGLPTGTASENNARALSNTIATVAAFKATTGGALPPACTYSVSPTTMAFAATGGSGSVSIAAPSGCTWQTSGGGGWVSLGTTGGSGNGTVTVTVAANTGNSRSATVSVAGATVTVNQAAPAAPPPTSGRVNVALASAGATASASSTLGGGFPAAGAIDGDRRGSNWERGGGWNDGTGNQYPDWLQVDFAGARSINEITVVTVQDAYLSPVEPSTTLTFAQYGITDFAIQYWDGGQWRSVPGGTFSGNRQVLRTVTFTPITTSRIRVWVTGSLAGYSRVTEVEAYQAESTTTAPATGVNVALASAGATASASSTLSSGFAASGTIDGDRRGTNWERGGGWNDGTGSQYPDWLQIDFAGARSIGQITVATVQDAYLSPVEPTSTTTFSQYGLTDFTIQYWDGGQWQVVPGGTISGNRLVLRTVTFTPVTTSRIRVWVTGSLAGFSRITEFEAIESGSAAPSAPPAGGSVNVAAASAGASASTSSIYSSAYGAAGAINGDRKGINWGAGGGWNDGTAASYPDWLQIDFAAAATIREVRVFTVQDDYNSPVEPTTSQLFSYYGITSFTVQYWDGGQWVTVPGGAITGNRNVWRTITFPAVNTTRIRVVVTDALNSFSRITEVEAY